MHGLEKPVLHRDLKTANVLLTEWGGVKISDFGESKLLVGMDEENDDDDATNAKPIYEVVEDGWVASKRQRSSTTPEDELEIRKSLDIIDTMLAQYEASTGGFRAMDPDSKTTFGADLRDNDIECIWRYNNSTKSVEVISRTTVDARPDQVFALYSDPRYDSVGDNSKTESLWRENDVRLNCMLFPSSKMLVADRDVLYRAIMKRVERESTGVVHYVDVAYSTDDVRRPITPGTIRMESRYFFSACDCHLPPQILASPGPAPFAQQVLLVAD